MMFHKELYSTTHRWLVHLRYSGFYLRDLDSKPMAVLNQITLFTSMITAVYLSVYSVLAYLGYQRLLGNDTPTNDEMIARDTFCFQIAAVGLLQLWYTFNGVTRENPFVVVAVSIASCSVVTLRSFRLFGATLQPFTQVDQYYMSGTASVLHGCFVIQALASMWKPFRNLYFELAVDPELFRRFVKTHLVMEAVGVFDFVAATIVLTTLVIDAMVLGGEGPIIFAFAGLFLLELVSRAVMETVVRQESLIGVLLSVALLQFPLPVFIICVPDSSLQHGLHASLTTVVAFAFLIVSRVLRVAALVNCALQFGHGLKEALARRRYPWEMHANVEPQKVVVDGTDSPAATSARHSLLSAVTSNN